MMSCWHLSGRSHQNFAMIFKNKNLEQWVYQLTKSFNILGRPKNGATLFLCFTACNLVVLIKSVPNLALNTVT